MPHSSDATDVSIELHVRMNAGGTMLPTLSALAGVADLPDERSDRMLRRAGFRVFSEVAGPRYPLRTYLRENEMLSHQYRRKATMKIAYVFAMPRSASYKLGQMILPQLEAGTHGVRVVGMFFFDDNVFVLRKGDPIGERLSKVAQQNGML